MSQHSISDLLAEYEKARAYTDSLWKDLQPDELIWRPTENASAIGWHLGHQAAVAHFMVRNLTAAETSFDSELDALMDSATVEPKRSPLPELSRLLSYRNFVAQRVIFRAENIDRGDVSAPNQLRFIAETMLTTIINHEYQHDKWIGEVRNNDLGYDLPDPPASDAISEIDGYFVVGATGYMP